MALLFYSLQKEDLKLVVYVLKDYYYISYQGPIQAGVISLTVHKFARPPRYW